MRLVRLVHLGATSAIKVEIVVKDKVRDRVTFKISERAKVRVSVSYVILPKNNRCTKATSVTFSSGIVRF